MKKKITITIIFILLVLIATYYPFSLTNLYSLDEIWNYGFGKNILDGLIPYKDFNMIVPPFFPYITALTLFIFGEKLIVYYFLIAVIVAGITYLAYKEIGFYSVFIYLLMLTYCSNGYNTITLLLLFILLRIINGNLKKQDIIIPIIISAMVLSKQTMALLIIPSLIYSKNKKKSLLAYTSCFLAFLVYLLLNNNLMSFIDYCFLGMFEFAEKNYVSVLIYFLIELFICLVLIYVLIKSKGRRKDIFYVLMYQIITFPIVDLNHFVLALAPCIYLFFKEKNLNEFIRKGVFIILATVIMSFIFIGNYTMTFKNRDLISHSNKDNFLKGKLVPSITNDYVEGINNFIEKYPEHKLYILGNYSYLVKLSLDIPINKYDLINNGNMGYHGDTKYIEEIDENCQKEKCLFIVKENELEQREFNQTNIKILEYVTSNYKKIYSNIAFGVYKN